MNRYWQDLGRTIPADKDGDSVAVAEVGLTGAILTQPNPAARPVLRMIPGLWLMLEPGSDEPIIVPVTGEEKRG